jgi:hypothetical protein
LSYLPFLALNALPPMRIIIMWTIPIQSILMTELFIAVGATAYCSGGSQPPKRQKIVRVFNILCEI